ncbi:hypothetical protein Ddc_07576 [Ditylenchus destructor]|nr:hypothetical protein Ddc_07576 [Ditylenchus destructor]
MMESSVGIHNHTLCHLSGTDTESVVGGEPCGLHNLRAHQRVLRAPSLKMQGRSLSAREAKEITIFDYDAMDRPVHWVGSESTDALSPPYITEFTGRVKSMTLQQRPNGRILPQTPVDVLPFQHRSDSMFEQNNLYNNSSQHCTVPRRKISNPSPTTHFTMECGRYVANTHSGNSVDRMSPMQERQLHISDSPTYWTREEITPTWENAERVLSPVDHRRKNFSNRNNAEWRSTGAVDTHKMSVTSNTSPPMVPASGAFSASFDFGDEPSAMLRPTSQRSLSKSPSPNPARRSPPATTGRYSKSPNAGRRPRTPASIRTDSTTSESGTGATTAKTATGNSGGMSNLGVDNQVHESVSLNNLHKNNNGNAVGANLANRRSQARSTELNNKAQRNGAKTTSPNQATGKHSTGSKKLPPISNSSQQIIGYCMENARGDIAGRVLARMVHKRDDFAAFCAQLAPEQWMAFLSQFRDYLWDVVRNLQNTDRIRHISMAYGMSHVPRRALGFKADFFSIMADALTTECVFLDGAAHQPTEAIEAWSELANLMFSCIRDGYYEKVRYLRRNTQHCFNSMFSNSSDHSTDGSESLSAPQNGKAGSNNINLSPATAATTACISVSNNTGGQFKESY